MKIQMKGFLLLFLILCRQGVWAQTQLNPYFINFETGATHPAIISYASTDTVLLDSIPWTMPGVFLGTMTASDFKNGVHSARFRLTNNTTGDPAFMEMLWDLPYGIQKIEFLTAMYGTETGGQLQVLLSTDNGQNWIPFGDTIFVTAPFSNPMTVTIEPSVPQPVRVKIQKLNPGDNRINVDDITITRYGTGNRLLLIDKTPIGQNVSIYTDTLTLSFDQEVIPNQGNLTLHNQEGGIQTFIIPSGSIVAQDSQIIVHGIQLQDDSRYFITLSDSAFTDPTQTFFSLPIPDSLTWSFKTEDTIMPPDVPPLTTLSESFLACNTAQNLMGLFRPYSITGNQGWECSSDGHEDLFSVSVSGGFSNGVSAQNEDWLISVLPFDFSGLAHPILSFWQKAVFDGNVSRSVRLSYNYPGYGYPLLDSVNWIELNIPGFNLRPENNWEFVDGIDLTEFKQRPFYLAFTYKCGTEGAYRLYYDDLQIGYPTGVSPIEIKNTEIKILGSVQTEIRLLLFGFENGPAKLILYNSLGERVIESAFSIQSLKHRIDLDLPEFSPGLYYISIANSFQQKAVKFFKQ